MAHFALLWKARTVEKYRLKYENEKINSIAMADIELPKKTVLQKWRHYRFDTQKRISKTFRQLYPEGSSLSNFIVYLRTKQTFTNALTKAVFGFVAGYVLSYLCFIFFVYQLSISVIYATVLSFIIGILLTVGLGFSHRVRCLVFLLIPQFFSRVGRYTLTCYALVLILTGPATNTLKNSEVLSESMACSQEQIKTSLNHLEESMKNPHNFLKDSVNQIAYTTKKISLKLKEVMIKINRLLLSVVSAIQMNFAWLKSIASGCNHKLGTPHQHCTEILKKSVKYCELVLGAIPRFCDVTYLTRASCDGTKAFDAFCGVSEFVDGCILATVRRRLREFSDRVKAMMYVEVYIHHSYMFSANVSHSDSQVASGIVTEIRNRADPLLTWLSWSSCVTSLFLLLIIFRAKYYQHMYETRSRFDNRYVTKELRDIDLKRMREGRETILPLNRREKAKYINITSFRLLASERTYLSRSVVFMTITTFKLLIHMVADYSLYWVLMTIRYHGSLQTPLHAELPKPVFNVSGHGFVTRLVKSLLNVLNIPLIETELSVSCLPNPHLPDFRRYMQIGLLIFMLWFFALFEPYGLRMRHVIMSHYRPERARERAMWLYNHLLRTRGSFIKFARRKLHREYKYKTETQSTFRMCLNIYLPFNFLRSLFGIGCEEMECLLCGTTPSKADFDTRLIRCKSKDCPGTYCSSCFIEIGQLCTICLYPEDYGDMSDVSLEKGSSEESDDSDDDNNESRNLIRDSNKNESLTKHSSGGNSTETDKRMKNYWTLFPKAKKYDEANFPLLPYTSHMMKKTRNEDLFITNNNYCNKAEKHFETLLLIEVFKISSMDSVEVFFPNKSNTISDVTKTLLLPETLKVMSTLPQNEKCFEMKINVFYIREKSYCLKFGKRHQLRKVNIRNSIDTILKYVPTNRNSVSLSNCFSICCFQDKITKTEGCNKKNKEDKKKIKKDKRRKRQPKQNPTNPKMEYKNDNFTNKFKNLSTVFSVYWNNETLKTSSRHKFFDGNKKFKLCEQKKNFKRRKKFLNVFCFNKKEIKMEKKIKDKDQAQKFRISAYFLDQEWFKRKYEIISRKNFFENATSNPSEELMSHDNFLKIKKTPPLCQMAKCTSSGMLTFPALEDNRTPPDDYSNCNFWHNQYQSKINITKKALQRFRDRVKKKIKSKQTIFEKNYNTECCTKECVPKNKHEQHDEEYIEYYPSIMSDDDSIDAVFEETENLHDKNKQSYKSKESVNPEPLYNELTRSYYDACKYSGACCSDDNRPEPAFCKWMNTSCVKTPFKLIKNFCVSLFGSSTEQILEETISSRDKENKVSKGVNVSPAVKSICCQHAQENAIRDNTSQLEKISPEIPQWTVQNSWHDATNDIIKRTCTCATQHCITNRNIGTWLGHHCNELHRAAKEHKRKMALEKSEETSLNTSESSSISENLSSCKSESSINSNGTKTDTTICSLATVEYREERITRRKPRTIVVTKANRSTLTDKAKVCDVSTITNDWWSPIVERKERRDENEIFLEKKRGDFTIIEKVHKRLRNTGVTTDGRIVKFKSRTQVIPPGVTDILSPSRYLLESQRYYNELFSSRFYTPHMYALNQVQRYQDNEKSRQPSIRHHTRRGHKNKKYDDSYSKKTDSIKMADSPRRRLQPYSFKQNKMYRSTPRSHHGKTSKPSNKKNHGKDTEDKDIK